MPEDTRDQWRLKYTEVQSQQMAFTQSPSVSNNPKIPTYVLFDFCSEDTRHKSHARRHKTQPHITDTNDTRHKTRTHALSWSLPKHNVAKRYFYRNYVRTEGFPEGDDTYWFPYSNAVGVCMLFMIYLPEYSARIFLRIIVLQALFCVCNRGYNFSLLVLFQLLIWGWQLSAKKCQVFRRSRLAVLC